MKRLLIVLVALLAGVETSAAATFLVTIQNNSHTDIASFLVRGGTIEGSTRVPASSKREVKITLPNGKCRAEFRFDYAEANYIDDDKVLDLCKYSGLVVS
jgi:hypothetical protein